MRERVARCSGSDLNQQGINATLLLFMSALVLVNTKTYKVAFKCILITKNKISFEDYFKLFFYFCLHDFTNYCGPK